MDVLRPGGATPRFAYVWQYTIRAERRSEFLAAYGSGGDWALLFGRDVQYAGTHLLQDSVATERYLTIDYWASRAARDAFRLEFEEELEALDRKCEAYTIAETFIGDFDLR